MPKTARPATDKRRQEILTAALEAFSERGYDATTLGEIRARSGASVGSIYHLFAGKEEIASAVYVEGLRGYQGGFIERMAAEPSAEGAVRVSVTYYLAWVEDNEKLARFLLTMRRTELLPAVREELRQMNRAFFRALKESLAPHVRAGIVKRIPWELFLVIVIGPAHEHARLWLAGRSSLRPVEAAPFLSDAAWAAVRLDPRRGQAAASPGTLESIRSPIGAVTAPKKRPVKAAATRR
jgi:AcrR family transcriptional regulator